MKNRHVSLLFSDTYTSLTAMYHHITTMYTNMKPLKFQCFLELVGDLLDTLDEIIQSSGRPPDILKNKIDADENEWRNPT